MRASNILQPQYPTLASQLWRAPNNSNARAHHFLRTALLAIGGTLLLTLSAKLQIPFYPVPFTMQTFVVLMLGIAFGARLAGATLLLYLAQGALGLPVFAVGSGGGIAYFAGPTGGFLLAFAPAAVVMGILAERGLARTFTSTILVMLLGSAIIFIAGVAWLAQFMDGQQALALGFAPFVYSEGVKILLAAVLVPGAWRTVEKFRAES